MTCCPPRVDRRAFLRTAAALTGASLLSLPATRILAAAQADAIVLSCMDYRLADDVTRFLDSLGLTDKYDHVILAGASAGAVADQFESWHGTFWSHLDVAIQLHGIQKVIVIDHRDCGAYKIAFGEAHLADPAVEMAKHAEVIREMAAEVKARHPSLAFEAYLMGLDGEAEKVAL